MKPEIKERFKKYLSLQNKCSETTIDQYLWHIQKYADEAAAAGFDDILSIDSYSSAHEILYRIKRNGHPVTGEELSDSYAAKIGYMVSTYWTFAVLYQLKKTNPFAAGCGIKKHQFRHRDYLDRDSDQMRQVLAYPWTLRDRALMYLLFASAARRSEVVSLTISDVYQEIFEEKTESGGTLTTVVPLVRIQCGKGGKPREVPISDLAYEHVQNWVKSLRLHGYQGNWLFPSSRACAQMSAGSTHPGVIDYTFPFYQEMTLQSSSKASVDVWNLANHIKPDTCYRIIRKVGQQLGFRLTPHVLRHSFGAGAVQAGNDISIVAEWMGHADIKTTMIYVHHTRKHLALQYKKTMAYA